MKLRQESSPNAWSFLVVAGLVACGAGSSLDEYADGVPDVVPSPIKVSGDAGDDDDDDDKKDGGSDAGRTDAGTSRDGGSDAGRTDAGGGQQGGGQQGGADIGSACTKTEECTAGGNCLTNVNLQIVQLDFPKGYCSKMGCMTDNDCPSGSGCLAITQTCLKTCTSANQCRTADGYQCSAPPLGGLGGAGGGSSTQYCLPTGLIGGGGGTMGTTPLGGLGGLLGGLGGTGALGGLLGGLGGTTGGR